MWVSWSDLIGSIGAGCLVTIYLLLQTGRMRAGSVQYCLGNALGAGLILLSLIGAFNLGAFLVEFFWFVISLLPLMRRPARD